jgi:hypothetical protein
MKLVYVFFFPAPKDNFEQNLFECILFTNESGYRDHKGWISGPRFCNEQDKKNFESSVIYIQN